MNYLIVCKYAFSSSSDLKYAFLSGKISLPGSFDALVSISLEWCSEAF